MITLLDKLSKEDLITVIANMHDTIQVWDEGYGISPDSDAQVLKKIGEACSTHCSKTNTWALPSRKTIIDELLKTL